VGDDKVSFIMGKRQKKAEKKVSVAVILSGGSARSKLIEIEIDEDQKVRSESRLFAGKLLCRGASQQSLFAKADLDLRRSVLHNFYPRRKRTSLLREGEMVRGVNLQRFHGEGLAAISKDEDKYRKEGVRGRLRVLWGRVMERSRFEEWGKLGAAAQKEEHRHEKGKKRKKRRKITCVAPINGEQQGAVSFVGEKKGRVSWRDAAEERGPRAEKRSFKGREKKSSRFSFSFHR